MGVQILTRDKGKKANITVEPRVCAARYSLTDESYGHFLSIIHVYPVVVMCIKPMLLSTEPILPVYLALHIPSFLICHLQNIANLSWMDI
jgi:hypothetical protein